MAPGDEAVGFTFVGPVDHRHPAWRLVELRGSWMEWCVGVGSG